MAFVSILGTTKTEEGYSNQQPDFFGDLNLDQIIAGIQKQSTDYPIKEFYYSFPSQEDVIYRQEIYQDIKNTEMYEGLLRFSADMRRSAEKELSPTFSGEPLQGACWQLESVYFYCKAVLELFQKLEKGIGEKRISSNGFSELFYFLKTMLEDKSFQEMQKAVYEVWEQFTSLKFTLEIMGNKVRIAPVARDGAYEGWLEQCFKEFNPMKKEAMHSPFAGDLFLSRFERRMLQAFFEKYPELEDKLTGLADIYVDYKNAQILRLEKEVQFYLAFYRFQEECKAMGTAFARPTLNDKRVMSGVGVYDLALACVNCPVGKEVVSNDFSYDRGEQFFVINGPNQGGKTTFARSLGQLVYFAKMGLDVNAESANLNYFDKLVTHFSVEESMESGQGKLMEELGRLAPIMNQGCENAFVIINELFTTAAHYDGCIMGARVLEHFINRNCMGVYVTHLRALGDNSKNVVRLSALLDGSSEHRRTYKIGRNQVVSNGFAEDIVEKYQLSYESLQSRLKHYGKPEGGN